MVKRIHVCRFAVALPNSWKQEPAWENLHAAGVRPWLESKRQKAKSKESKVPQKPYGWRGSQSSRMRNVYNNNSFGAVNNDPHTVICGVLSPNP